ncbi:MAG: PEP/pyruvate-binding domain-containing protein [Anaerolineales bacterium]|nr:PEP/pyruvate-binding domain-containing protein [Anaerolineales bacterium]
MRRVLFESGVITQAAFEGEARERAIQSQAREALHDPFGEEPADVWDMRLSRVRDHLTDFHFAYNLPYERFEQIVRDTLAERGAPDEEMRVSFNPELAPQFMLFEQASALEKLPPGERQKAEHRLREIKVVLIRTMISDQLAYVKIAKDWLTIDDLREIRQRKIGGGKIGGKAAGMLLARRILMETAPDDIRDNLCTPESYYLGADVTYQFMAMNALMHWGDQKYKTEEQIRLDYPEIVRDCLAGHFPSDVLEELRCLLEKVDGQPLIVRSSSLLEDNFGTSFAGKYESHFCPNQGKPEENLRNLTQAIQRIYASIFNADALLYRRSKGLQDYDERMAILIQTVEGERFGRYFLPHAAGVAFSRNQFRWSPQIRREDGFVRLVWGLGTRAVDRVGNDYPRLVALSHPLLHPQASVKDIRRYSQQSVDLINLEENAFQSLPVAEVLTARYEPLRYIAQLDQGGYLTPLRSILTEGDTSQLVLTFNELLRRTPLPERLRKMVKLLEEYYQSPVDTEFTIKITESSSSSPQITICLLQCRPQSHLKESKANLPPSINPADVIFSTSRVVPQGIVSGIQYVLFVTPEGYFSPETPAARAELVRCIGLLNARLEKENFICVGPGRWGTSNPDLGVPIGYGDIYYSRALVELSGKGIGPAPEPSFGTHFFQDLLESQIYPLAVYLDDPETVFNQDFFYHTPNLASDFLPEAASLEDCLRLIRVSSYRTGYQLDLIMDDERGQAVALLVQSD